MTNNPQHLGNGASIYSLISCIQAFDWYQNRWPWITFCNGRYLFCVITV